MKFLKDNIGLIVVAIISVAVTALCFVLFYKPKSGSEEAFKDKIEMFDRMLEREQEITNQDRERSNEIIKGLMNQDSIKQVQVKATKQRINEIPTRVNNFSRDELRRAIEEF